MKYNRFARLKHEARRYAEDFNRVVALVHNYGQGPLTYEQVANTTLFKEVMLRMPRPLAEVQEDTGLLVYEALRLATDGFTKTIDPLLYEGSWVLALTCHYQNTAPGEWVFSIVYKELYAKIN